ncbi:MAG: SDR family oxidoreductase [Acetobacteraceae bacterium]|nr:SDR family oxidoreductase [Acetobacteraceae bacterium]
MQELSGQVVIVTGASRGIGAASAEALASAGAAVVLAARDQARVSAVARRIAEAGGRAEAAVCDVADWDSVQGMVAETKRRFGAVTALVNNAGVIEPIARLEQADPAAWARNVQINLIGAFHAIRAVLPEMRAVGRGTIVNISSGAALRPLEGWSAYCAAKAGLAMLTQAVALEAVPGLRVFGFQPGTTDTEMQVTIRASGVNPISQIPRAQLTPVEEPARAVVYLCTPAAGDLSGKEFSLREEAFRSRLGL